MVGVGEVAPIAWFGSESLDDVDALLRGWGPVVSDDQLDALPEPFASLRFALHAARRRGFALARPTDKRPDYLPVAALLPAGVAGIEMARARGEAGFRSFKWKVGVSEVAGEIAMLDDLLAVLPTGSKLRLDANGAWSRRDAERWMAACGDRPVEFVEQPVSGEGTQGEDLLRGLSQDYPTPIALDESVASPADVRRWLGLGWRGAFVLKPALLGDPLLPAKLVRDGIPCVFSSALETRVGARSALAQAFACAGGTSRAVGFGVWPLFAEGRFDGPAVAPFIRWSDVEALDVEAAWNALD